jgi:zinc finger protein
MRESRLDAPCPECGGALTLTATTLDIPHFGPALLTAITCAGCPFRRADTLLTREQAPARYTLRVDSPERLRARVVRSQSGTIRVPELGASLEPGPQSESFLTSAEGVLWRFRDIAASGRALGEGGWRAVVERIDRMIAGAEAFTLIIEDPTGNSAVVDPAVVRQAIPEEEAARLKRGATVIDVSDAGFNAPA